MIQENVNPIFYEYNLLTDKINYFFLLAVILFVRLPPLYIFPFLRTSLLTSHNLSRIILLYLLAYTLVKVFIFPTRAHFNKTLSTIILFYFATASISIIQTVNVIAFLQIYKDLVFGILLFIVIVAMNTKRKYTSQIIHVLVLSIFINILFQYLIYFNIFDLAKYLNIVFYDKYLDAINLQMRRGRYFVDIYDAALLPIVIFYFLKGKKIFTKLVYMLLIISIIFFTVVSNFRKQLLVSVLSFLSSMLVFKTKNLLTMYYILSFFLILFFLNQITYHSLSTTNTIQRFLLTEEEDIHTINTRIYFWKKAIEMGLSSPITGIGLGNYYDYFTPKTPVKMSISDPKNELERVTAIHPHNVFFAAFAETGLLGLLSTTTMFGYFFWNDIKQLRKKGQHLSPIVLCFWGLFLFSLLGPDTIIQYKALFWILRALISFKSYT